MNRAIVLLLFPVLSFATIDKTKDLSAYGKIGIIGHVLGEDLSLEDNGSRVGVYATKKLYQKYDIYVRGEWAFNALNNTSNLSVGDNKNFVSEAEEAQTFNRRLGYLAVDLKEYGELRFGKQWSVYSDISLMTSVFNIYGSSSTGTFNFRTDGGQVGTGRASKAVSYRKSWGNFDIGLQAKLIKNRQLSINDNEVDITAKDSFGVSLKHGFLDKKFTLGLAFNEIDIQGDEIEAIGYDGGRSWSAVFGMEIKFETITIAVTLNQSKNHEISDEDIVFDAIGGEASLVYKINEFYSFLIGMNKLDDRDDLEGDFKKELYITGIDFKLHDEVNLYSEIQLNESRQSNGEKLDSSYGFGGTFRF